MKILVSILENVQDHKVNEKILFIDDQDFFFDQVDGYVRTAKTNFSDQHQIYMSRPLLYEKLNQDYSALMTSYSRTGTSSWVKSHSYLEALGNKVRELTISNPIRYQHQLMESPS